MIKITISRESLAWIRRQFELLAARGETLSLHLVCDERELPDGRVEIEVDEEVRARLALLHDDPDCALQLLRVRVVS